MRLKLEREWELGAPIGAGGFGQVYAAALVDDPSAGPFVVKLVPKAPGAQRELLFANLGSARNVVPIIESGETDDSWALVMPKAEKSLRQYIDEFGGAINVGPVIPILTDVATALADLNGKVVHRDLKPENVLLLNGVWCLADFGISRYAEATTSPDTQKFAMSIQYAAPERWRAERATGATDVYALGILGFELLTGAWPFAGPEPFDFRDQHLHADPRSVTNVPMALASLIAECLYKSPGSRPSPQNILTRLQSAGQAPVSPGRARLQQANLQEVARQGESVRRESAHRSEAERRQDLFRDAAASFKQIGDQLKYAIAEDAPSAAVQLDRKGGWSVRINEASLEVGTLISTSAAPWIGWQPPVFQVIAHTSISVRVPRNRMGYEGRSHSLWFCDAREDGRYGWFETAFMFMPLMNRSSSIAPFSMDPGEGAAKALWTGMAEYQLAWPFMPLQIGDLSEFVDRWIGWFADATQGRLQYPSMMPERQAEGSWRR
jgi:serine/threonine-protein kinase